MATSPIVPEVSLITRAVKAVLGWVGIRDAEQKMRENAANWLELADKVWHYRRDRLTAAEAGELKARTDDLRQRMKERADAAKLKLIIEELEGVLRRTGGAVYPKSALVENVEFFLVAAIVILGIRTYFVQPFKIPTNSMWPTYYGMTGENFPPGTEAPSGVARIFRLIAYGAQRKEVIAPRSGEVFALFGRDRRLVGAPRQGRNWLIFPAAMMEYTFIVDGQPAKLRLPADFHDFDRLVIETYFGSDQAFQTQMQRLQAAGKLEESYVRDEGGPLGPVIQVPLGKTVKAGDPIIRFDLLTGDQLFVDRMSYHFVPPKVGQGFVFRTEHINSPYMRDNAGGQIESYYIKRLVGTPGDTLEIKSPVLYRNGNPITGSSAFAANATREGKYTGYTNQHLLSAGEKLTVSPQKYFAMGDNSSNSADSRYWGFVPAKDVAGRPLFIYYPFTRRWGPAR
ncbi:MAG: signal peptidase I [Opitutaceae bacterium]